MRHALHTVILGSALLAAAAARVAAAGEFFVAPTGDDKAPGTLEKPFATIQRAQAAAAPGDTVYVRGGTYAMTEAQIARKQRIWAYVTFLDKSGQPGKPIKYWRTRTSGRCSTYQRSSRRACGWTPSSSPPLGSTSAGWKWSASR